MANHDQRWGVVAGAIVARMDQLGLSRAEVQRRAEISDKTLKGYIEGQPIVRADKRRGLCVALQWPPDAIERLLVGDDLHGVGLTESRVLMARSRLAELLATQERIRQQMAETRSRRLDLESRAARLEDEMESVANDVAVVQAELALADQEALRARADLANAQATTAAGATESENTPAVDAVLGLIDGLRPDQLEQVAERIAAKGGNLRGAGEVVARPQPPVEGD